MVQIARSIYYHGTKSSGPSIIVVLNPVFWQVEQVDVSRAAPEAHQSVRAARRTEPQRHRGTSYTLFSNAVIRTSYTLWSGLLPRLVLGVQWSKGLHSFICSTSLSGSEPPSGTIPFAVTTVTVSRKCFSPLSSELGTFQTVTARFWLWREQFSEQKSL